MIIKSSMKKICLSDISLKKRTEKSKLQLTFREKIETAKLLDRLGVDVIEVEGLSGGRAESLRVKAICAAVKKACIAVPVNADGSDATSVLEAAKEAPKLRLQVELPVSSVQMEYLSHVKPEGLLKQAADTVRVCAQQCREVEFVAVDATRADLKFLEQVLKAVIEAGAETVTLCDSAGTMLPREFSEFLKGLYGAVPELKKVRLGLNLPDEIAMALPCALEGIEAGADELKITAFGEEGLDLNKFAKVLFTKQEELGVRSGLKKTEFSRLLDRIRAMKLTEKSSTSPFENGVHEELPGQSLGVHDSEEAVEKAVRKLGYELSDEDSMKVYTAFRRAAEKKDSISFHELEMIIASEAMQVPESYRLESYMVTSGNQIEATAHIKLNHDGRLVDGISLGDGPIDAAFLAIEKITGCHYELDDFQIQSITEGREAMGQTLVRLRNEGKLYSGRGISTDIIGSAVKAYLSALNRIAYEEEKLS